MTKLNNRYDFIYLFDVKDGNPNGDPDAGNLPRVDAETGHGLVTDVCLKRKVRNYVQVAKGTESGYDIFIKEKAILNKLINEIEPAKKDKEKRSGEEIETARKNMCKKYFDIRAFGAVLSTGANAGQVRGPIQFTFARSIDPIIANEHSITRMAVTTQEDAEKQSGDNRTMGRKFTIPYGLYKSHGFVSVSFAEQTEFSAEDLEFFWEALLNMFENDRSAARGLMSTQKLIIFKHSSKLGNAPVQDLFKRVSIERNGNSEKPARDFSDYIVKLDGVEIKDIKKIVEVQ
jgi:CRISPR-associated protein Csd2